MNSFGSEPTKPHNRPIKSHTELKEPYNGPTKPHSVQSTLHEIIDYPPHDLRTVDPIFDTIRHQRIVVNNEPCFICGITNSIIKSDRNPDPKRYQQMELHHCLVEWALANAIDSDKWKSKVLPLLQSKSGLLLTPSTTAPTQIDPTFEDIVDWVHHGDENLLVLCNVHHRSSLTGIHKVSYPAWISQLYLKDEYLVK